MMEILEMPSSTAKEKIMAFKAILTAEAQNQRDEHTASLQSDRNRFLEIAQQLGINTNAGFIKQESASSGDECVD
jgi:hypothetical protein